MKTLSTMIRDYLDETKKELNNILENKNIDTSIWIEGTFSPVQDGKVFIQLSDDDLETDEERFDSVIFFVGFNSFEIYKEDIFFFFDKITNDLNIKENFKINEEDTVLSIYEPIIDEKVMTFSEACERWGLSESTLRMAVKRGTLEEGKDYRKSGKVWLITKEAMKEKYGDEK